MAKTKQSTKNVFSLAVEQKAKEEDIGYIDALSSVMEECDMEPVQVSKLINSSLKGKLEVEARNLRLIKGGNSNPTLPIL